jgi:hypothetical protein
VYHRAESLEWHFIYEVSDERPRQSSKSSELERNIFNDDWLLYDRVRLSDLMFDDGLQIK